MSASKSSASQLVTPGKAGPAGRGVQATAITNGRLIVTYTDGTTADVGEVVGPRGNNGTNGTNGQNGRGISSAAITNQRLILTYTDGTTADLGVVVGAPGSNASATPLAVTLPLADAAVAAVGSSTSAARADHQHPLTSGRLEFIGNVTFSQNVTAAVTMGIRRVNLALTGVAASDKLVFAPLSPCVAGCEAVNLYPSGANQVTLSYWTPVLTVGSVINIPVAVYRIV